MSPGQDASGEAAVGRDLLARMLLIRAFEERVIELCHRKVLEGLVHVGIGQEGVAVGVASALAPTDYLYGTHRSHGHFLARGTDPGALMAELAGKETGLCRGRGGSMHIVDVANRCMTATGIVGGTIPLALGTALATRGEGSVVAVYFGDGASNTGSFHECLNMAALWKLPVVLVCENNGYAEFTPMSAHTVVSHVSVHGQPYGIRSEVVDGNDIIAVRAAATTAAERARRGEGPSIVECLTYRLRGHYVGDPASYREAQEVAEWRDKDPIGRLSRLLQDHDALPPADLAALQAKARADVDTAVRFMSDSPWPRPATVADDVYAAPERRHERRHG